MCFLDAFLKFNKARMPPVLSRSPNINTWVNTQGGITTVIGNMMITTGYISGISGVGYYQGTFSTNSYSFLYPPMMSAVLSFTNYGTTLYPVMNGNYSTNTLSDRTKYYITPASGTGTFQGGGAWNLMYTAIGMI